MKLALVALWATMSLVEGYRILCVFPVPSPSHNILGRGIVDALLQAGHQVWWATPYPEMQRPAANLTVIDVSATKKVFENLNMTSPQPVHEMPFLAADIAAIAAAAPEIQRAMLMVDFHAVVTEWFASDLPAGYAAVQQAPWIMLSSVVAHTCLEMLVDDVTSTALVPTMLTRAPLPMGFFQRVANSLIVGAMKIASWAMRVYSSKQYADLFTPLAAARGSLLPPLSEVYNNVSILLVNSHPVLAPAQSFPPNVVDIAGYHIKENTSLPEALQRLLDSSSQGFVYFSLGSVVQVSELPVGLKTELAQMFGELPYTVLWRSDEELQNLPKTVHVRKWFPQPGILAHRNIKLFITHAGLLSIIEAVHHGVPILAVPVFGDQPMNAARAVAAGFAGKVDFHIGMASELRSGLDEMVGNGSYYKTAKHLSKLFHRRPVPPSELIPHYVELAIESQGAYHLRSAARHYPWYARARIDQLLFCAALFYGLYIASRIVVRQLRTHKRKAE
ncbi:UDP-glucosyltransferase 2-like [Cydia pomonella]|uniref:UDP-glucosyltransferase 2-like n=1 Tax=Cydia pomonella TaxID=82600 RepID=UPI002ADDCA88|nr:UDP-glucosyltransferase 2-like [Cydia pomonella]